jgi:hypothetical protein
MSRLPSRTRDTLGCEGVDVAPDAGPESPDGARGRLPEHGLQLGEGPLDRVEVGAVGREAEQARPGCPDRRAHVRPLAAAEVIHDDDVAGLQLGHQHLVDVGPEGGAVEGALEHQGRDHAGPAQPGDEGGGLPVPVRDAGP